MRNKIGFWFWVLLVPFSVFLGYANYVTDHMTLFWINVVTVVCATLNAFNSRKNIISEEEFQRWLDGKE